jgi:glycerophosphoryl diester phosphodiesterase
VKEAQRRPASFLLLPGRTRPYVMAHRGNRAACPENTLAAFRHALADGADILETDLHLTADGEFVCIHDGTVERTTDGHGSVADLTLAQVKALSACCGRKEFGEERVPVLSELAAILPSDVSLALELKTDRFLEPPTCERLVAELDRAGVRDRTVVLSFSAARVLAVHRMAPDVPAGWITLSRPWPPLETQLLGPFWPLLVVNPLYVWAAHHRGQVVCPLDPDPDARLWFYQLLGCDAVLSDNPETTCRALGRPKPRHGN